MPTISYLIFYFDNNALFWRDDYYRPNSPSKNANKIGCLYMSVYSQHNIYIFQLQSFFTQYFLLLLLYALIQVDELMRQELKNLKLAVDRETEKTGKKGKVTVQYGFSVTQYQKLGNTK